MHNRIPDLNDSSTEAMSHWFSDMADAGLIFHPENPASEILHINSKEAFFSEEEAKKAQLILDEFFNRFGNAAVIDAAYPHFMRAAGRQ